VTASSGKPERPEPEVEQHRRRVPRQSAGWFAKCSLEGDPEQRSTECRVIDISTIGAGVEVLGMVDRHLVGRRLIVEIQAPTGATFSVRFVGEIKNAGVVPHGGVRIGMLFVGLSETEQQILNLFEQMQVSW
jgi:hypothetical protein